MKQIQNIILASAAATLLLTGCAEKFDTSYQVDKPESVALNEYLNSFEVLKNYTGIKLGTDLTTEKLVNKDATYSQVMANFTEVNISDAFGHNKMVADDGTIDVTSASEAVNAANAAGFNVFAYNLLSPSMYNMTTMKEVTKDTWVPGVHEENDVVIDFEDKTVGSTIEGDNFSVIANDPAGQNGLVLSNTKNAKFMTIHVTLPEGVKVSDMESISFDYRTSKQNKDLVFRIKVGSEVATKSCGKPETLNTWTNYSYNLQRAGIFDALTEESLEANSFDLIVGQGATPQKVYVDNIKIHTSYTKEGYYEPRPIEEKAVDVKNHLNSYVGAMMENYGTQIKTWVVASDLLDDFLGMMKSSEDEPVENEFYPNDYLGENYVADICQLIHSSNADIKLFYSENNLLGNDMKQDGLMNYLTQWNEAGAKIEGVDARIDLPYNAETLEETKANYETLLNNLKGTGLLVRLSDLNVYLADDMGGILNLNNVTTEQLKAMADFYRYVVSKYLEIIPAEQQYGLSFSTINETSLYVGLWKNYNRLPTYVGIANGLQSKEIIW